MAERTLSSLYDSVSDVEKRIQKKSAKVFTIEGREKDNDAA